MCYADSQDGQDEENAEVRTMNDELKDKLISIHRSAF